MIISKMSLETDLIDEVIEKSYNNIRYGKRVLVVDSIPGIGIPIGKIEVYRLSNLENSSAKNQTFWDKLEKYI